MVGASDWTPPSPSRVKRTRPSSSNHVTRNPWVPADRRQRRVQRCLRRRRAPIEVEVLGVFGDGVERPHRKAHVLFHDARDDQPARHEARIVRVRDAGKPLRPVRHVAERHPRDPGKVIAHAVGFLHDALKHEGKGFGIARRNRDGLAFLDALLARIAQVPNIEDAPVLGGIVAAVKTEGLARIDDGQARNLGVDLTLI